MESLCIFSDPNTMTKEIASQLEKNADQAEKDGRIFTLVLSGGSTCIHLYRAIAEQRFVDRIPWHVIHLFWADERCAPPENEESNYRICRGILLDCVVISNSNIHRIRGEEDPILESTRYAKEIQDHMMLREGQANFFDWVFLGVGTDGHTASLFAGDDSLNSSNLCEVAYHPQTSQKRVTLTPLAIRKSNRITYHVIGRGKSDIISKLVFKESVEKKYPANFSLGEWYLDKEAAFNLSPGINRF